MLSTFLILVSFQILMSVQPTSITVMSMLSVITLMDRITAHAALDTLEMEHHVPVNHKLYPVHLTEGLNGVVAFTVNG